MKLGDLGTLFLLGGLWGGSFLFIRIGAPVLGPFVLADARVLIAGAALVAVLAAMGRRLGFGARWRGYLLLGTVNVAVPFVLVGTAALRLPASFLATTNAAIPLFTALVAAIWLGEALTRRKVAGLLLGVAGVGILVGWNPLGMNGRVALAIGCSLGGSLCYGVGSVYARRAFGTVPPLELSAGQLLAAGVLLLPPSLVTAAGAAPDGRVVLATLALALASTALAYVLFFRLNQRVGPTKTSTVAFLIPGFGLLFGALFLGETIGVGTVVGLAVILASVGLVTDVRVGSFPRPRAERVAGSAG